MGNWMCDILRRIGEADVAFVNAGSIRATFPLNGTWTGNWASRNVTLAVCEYVATSQEIDSSTGLGNPLIEWNNTSRLISNTLVDNENAILVMKDEAASSGGLLSIDTQPHFIQY